MANRRITRALAERVGIELNESLPAYAWPGGYPMYYVTREGTVLCQAHAEIEGEYADELITDADVNWEDAGLFCEHGERIESAYAEDEAQA